jgi:hypothetical protein
MDGAPNPDPLSFYGVRFNSSLWGRTRRLLGDRIAAKSKGTADNA